MESRVDTIAEDLASAVFPVVVGVERVILRLDVFFVDAERGKLSLELIDDVVGLILGTFDGIIGDGDAEIDDGLVWDDREIGLTLGREETDLVGGDETD